MSGAKLDSEQYRSDRWDTIGLSFSIFLRSWLLILLAGAVGGSAVYFASESRTPIYKADTTLFIRTGQSAVSVSLGEIQASRELGRTFKELIKTSTVLDQVRDELGLPYSVSGLRASISVNVISGTQLLVVSARDPSAALAADISDTVARVFIVQREEAGLTEIARLQATLEQYGILDSAELLASQINSLGGLQIAQSAEIPANPVSPRPLRDALLGIIVGFGLALVLVVILDRIDTKIRTDSHLAEIAKSFNIGSVGIIPREMIEKTFRPEPGKDGNVTTEAFMFLAAKILDHQHEHIAVRDYLVTSVHQNEGKTVVSANVAAALASANRKVILVDFDLRKPDISEFTGTENDLGVTSVINGIATLEECLIDTVVPNLRVLVSGPIPPDPTGLFNSPGVSKLMDDLRGIADIVIYDSAPLDPVADSWMLMHEVHACILTVEQGKSSHHEINSVAERINGTSIRTLCTVLNRVTRPGMSGKGRYGYGYGYGYGYSAYGRYKPSNDPKQPRWRKPLAILDRVKSLGAKVRGG